MNKNGLEGYMLGVTSSVYLWVGCVHGYHEKYFWNLPFLLSSIPQVSPSGNSVGPTLLATHPEPDILIISTTRTLVQATGMSLLNHFSCPLTGLSAPTLAAQSTHNIAARITLSKH